MKLGDRDELASYLVQNWDYVPAQAPQAAEKLLNMDPAIREAFESWLETGEFPATPAYLGHSPESLNKLVRLKPPAVFLLLDWIRREPHEATRAIQEELLPSKEK